MRKKIQNRSFISAACISALLATGLIVSPAAAASDIDSPVKLSAPGGTSFTTAEGSPLRVLSDSSEAGERIITAQTVNGEPAKIAMQRVPRATVFPAQADLAGQVSLSPATVANPGLITQTVIAAALSTKASDWIPSSSYAVTRTTATFRWDRAVGSFTAYQDGKLLGDSTGGSYVVTGLVPGVRYSFELRGNVRDSSGSLLKSAKSITVTTFPLDASEARKQLVSPMTYQTYNTAFVHKTFIPDAQVSAAMCNWAQPSYTFKGDNRSYSLPNYTEPYEAPNYRTMMFASINWDNPAPYTVVTAKGVGESVTYNNGTVVQATYASTNNMLFTDISSGGAYAQVRFDHTASNPHCKLFDVNYGGAIKYNELVMFYRGGMVDVEGWRSPVPAHEGYARFNDSFGNENWQVMFQKSNQGFVCLIYGTCANDPISKQLSY